MSTFPLPDRESERLQELISFKILDTSPEEEFDEITRLASEICDTPVSLISLIDQSRQWFKSTHGIDISETSREVAFCAHAICEPDSILEVPDSRNDERFKNNPYVTGENPVIFYAGIPLVTSNGNAVGTLCVLDYKPQVLSHFQRRALKTLASQVMKNMELRKLSFAYKREKERLEQKNEDLRKFAYVISHDLKSPLNNIAGLNHILRESMEDHVTKGQIKTLDFIDESVDTLRSLIDNVLEHYTATAKAEKKEKQFFGLRELMKECVNLFPSTDQSNILLPEEEIFIKTSRGAIQQILVNLISNGLKYNTQDNEIVWLDFRTIPGGVELVVGDNGIGIDKKDQDRIFELFTTLGIKDRFSNVGSGIGLSTVKRLVESMDGNITLKSKKGKGSEFTIQLPVEVKRKSEELNFEKKSKQCECPE